MNSVYQWIDTHKIYDKEISDVLFKILNSSDNEKIVQQAFFSINQFKKLEDNEKLIVWYESPSNRYKNNKHIKKRYIELIRDDKKKLCIRLLKQLSIEKLIDELEHSDDIEVGSAVFWASWRDKKVELFDVFAILILKFNLWETASIEYMYKVDKIKTEEIVLKYFEKGLNLKYPSLHNHYSGIAPLVKIYVEKENRDTVISVIQKVLRTDDNGDIHSALKLVKGFGEKYLTYDQNTVDFIWKILNNYRNTDKHYECIVILSLDKNKHTNIIKWYNEVLKKGVGQNEIYRNKNQFEFITRYLNSYNIISKND